MVRKRLLLMYISKYSGHHRATQAIEQAIHLLSPDTEVLTLNSLNYTNPILEKVVNRTYMRVIKSTPEIWDYLYDNPKIVKNTAKIREMIHKLNAPKLEVLFDEFQPEAVACTQAFPCGMIADYKKFRGVNHLFIAAILTDFHPHSYWVADSVDLYAVHSEAAVQRLMEEGIDQRKICLTGIPIDLRFLNPLEKEAIYQRLNLTPSEPVILVMGGGSGIGPIKDICVALDQLDVPLQQVIVTGTNERLYKELVRLAPYRKKTVIFRLVDNIAELMEIATCVVTKPGGLTTAEALAKGLPIVIISPIPGQEAQNAQILLEWNVAVKAETIGELVEVVKELLSDPHHIEEFRQAALSRARPQAAIEIARHLLHPDGHLPHP